MTTLERNQAMCNRYAAGETYEANGLDYKLTRERIRQIVHVHAFNHMGGRDAYVQIIRQNRAAKRSQSPTSKQQWALLATQVARDLHCRLCGSWILRLNASTTCSSECAEDWIILRYILDEDQWQRHRDQIGRKGPPNRRFVTQKVATRLRKYFPNHPLLPESA